MSREAKTLGELLRIREANRSVLNADYAVMGTALGRHHESDKPAIHVFVRRKIHEKWLAPDWLVPATLSHGNLHCQTDVIQSGGDLIAPVSPDAVQDEALAFRQGLRGESDRISAGSQLSFADRHGIDYSGTLGAIVRRKEDGALGLLTNAHVGDHVGNVLTHPDLYSRRVARMERTVEMISGTERWPGIGSDQVQYRMDCGFARFIEDERFDPPKLDVGADLMFLVPDLVRDGSRQRVAWRRLGASRRIDPDDPNLWPLYEKVRAVGRTMGDQSGVVQALCYEASAVGPSSAHASDLLIRSATKAGFFSQPGDSGKLVVTDEHEPRPLGLLWGGHNLRTDKTYELEDHSLAASIDVVLDQLGIEILKEAP